MGLNFLCTDTVKICICLDEGEKAKHCVSCMNAFSLPCEHISLDSDTMYKLIDQSLVFPFVYNIIVFYSFFQGTSLFVHTLAVMSQFVQ